MLCFALMREPYAQHRDRDLISTVPFDGNDGGRGGEGGGGDGGRVSREGSGGHEGRDDHEGRGQGNQGMCRFYNTLKGCVCTVRHYKHVCSLCGSNKHGATACGKKK